MADLLESLITRSRSSQESFHSSYSEVQPTSPVPDQDTTMEDTAQRTISSRAQGPDAVHDVDAFLNESANRVLLDSATKNKLQSEPTKSSTPAPSSFPIEPVQLGAPKSSHHVTLLYQICQDRGYTPVFHVEESAQGSQRFGGMLIVGRETVTLDLPEGSKKEARQALAEKGCELVRCLDAKSKPKKDDAVKAENWVGKLTEFHSLTSSSLDPSPSFTEFAVGPAFACEVNIRQSTDPLGSRTRAFPNKKSAKSAAAHDAIKYLIEHGHLLPDGSIPAHLLSRKKPKIGTAVKAEPGNPLTKTKPESEKSWGEKVSDLYPLLGLAAPQYKLEPTDPIGAPTLFSGAAWFPLDVEVIPGPVGEVRHVLGRKRAREECAKGVWLYLEALRRKRLGTEEGEIEEEEDFGDDDLLGDL